MKHIIRRSLKAQEQFGKKTKINEMRYLLIINMLFFQMLFSQENKTSFSRENFCECKIKGQEIKNNDDGKILENSVSSNVTSFKDSLKISLYNTTKDTVFLFNSYFSDDISTSKFLYRINKKESKRKISFLPLVPYLFTKYSDNIIIKDRVVKNYQVVYNFEKIPPNYKYEFYVKIKNYKDLNMLIKDFDLVSLNKFQPIKKIKTLKVAPSQDFEVELAYYKNVNLLCNKNDYFLKELEFNTQAKSFETIRVKLY